MHAPEKLLFANWREIAAQSGYAPTLSQIDYAYGLFLAAWTHVPVPEGEPTQQLRMNATNSFLGLLHAVCAHARN